MNDRIKKIIYDMIPIILGILIALLINNWNQTRQEKAFVQEVLKSVTSEMKENRESLTQIIKEHESLIGTIDTYLNEDVTIGELLNKSKGLRVSSIKHTAWKAFLNNSMVHVDYSYISPLTDIDESKEVQSILMEKLMDNLMNNLESESYIDKQTFLIMIGDLLINEKDMLEYHQTYLDAVEKID